VSSAQRTRRDRALAAPWAGAYERTAIEPAPIGTTIWVPKRLDRVAAPRAGARSGRLRARREHEATKQGEYLYGTRQMRFSPRKPRDAVDACVPRVPRGFTGWGLHDADSSIRQSAY
jgi:hypothetical protein